MSPGETDYRTANLLADDDDDFQPVYNEIRKEPDVSFPLPIDELSNLRLAPSITSTEEVQDFSPPPPTRIAPQPQLAGNGRLVIGIDYGTTYTGLAWAITNSEHADMKNIEVMQNWTPKMSNQQKVRSVLSYAETKTGEAQWGSDISASAITMVNTKLELEPREKRFDELDLTLQVLAGTGYLQFDSIRNLGPDPAYSTKEPTEIVTDYLSKILQSFLKVARFEPFEKTNTLVDIVVTVPVDWSYQAHKSMFQAIRGAGFNKQTFPTLKHTILVTEPEAASYFTSRDLQNRRADSFQEEDCFILCDAGGGTVDLISFQVKKLMPYFDLEKATKASGGNYGSSLIDTRFKGWLRNAIGPDNYAELDPANARKERISPHTVETGPMRKLLEKFFDRKSTFSMSKRSDITLELPAPLNKLNVENRVVQGELTMKWNEMKRLMDPSVNGVLELIDDQIEEVVKAKSREVRNVLLVGGFGGSPYLQEQLREGLAMRDIQLHRPLGVDNNQADPSLTAVVQGAVIYGIEKARHKDASYMTAVTKSYAVVNGGKFEWLTSKGDLVMSNKETTKESQAFWHPVQSCVKGKYEFPIYYHRARSENDTHLPKLWRNGQHEVDKAGVVKCDFSNMLDRDLRPIHGSLMPGAPNASRSRTSIGPLSWRLKLTTTIFIAEILLNGAPLAKCEFKAETEAQDERRKSGQRRGPWDLQDDSD